MRLDGRVALVTGGGGGIGAAVCRGLAAEGALVGVADIDHARADRVAAELGGFAVSLDVTDAGSVAGAVDAVGNRLGLISLLFNVAGVAGRHSPLLTLEPEGLRRAFDVNVTGTLLMTQAVARPLVAASRSGAIVNVGSAAAFRPKVGMGHYGATKAAVHTLTMAAALELAPHHIRVNAVAPGPVSTPMTNHFDDPTERAEWERMIPLGRIADPEDLVPLMLLLACDEARNMTGAIVSIDGGRRLG
jgi:NAD(P)-dependent dehydrogenase (short-subunit alcohol dehydrogenase family)